MNTSCERRENIDEDPYEEFTATGIISALQGNKYELLCLGAMYYKHLTLNISDPRWRVMRSAYLDQLALQQMGIEVLSDVEFEGRTVQVPEPPEAIIPTFSAHQRAQFVVLRIRLHEELTRATERFLEMDFNDRWSTAINP